MFISKYSCDLFSINSINLLQDVQLMHRAVQRLFKMPRKESGALYRVERNDGMFNLYIMSRIEPDKQAGEINGMKFCWVYDMKHMFNNIQEGLFFAFDLEAAPVIRRGHQKLHILNADKRNEWLRRQGEKGGFKVVMCENNDLPKIFGSKGDQVIQFTPTRYTGVLQITDPEAFKKTWATGIGPEKAYSMGMMLLIPAH